MNRVTRALIVTCGLGLSGCSSVPGLDFLQPAPPQTIIQLESEPAGAEAKTSLGPSCQTPCSVTVATNTEFSITYSLNGYLPQTVPVRPVLPEQPVDLGLGPKQIQFAPNPVFAQLEPMPPVKKKKPIAKKPKPAATPQSPG